MTYTPGFLYDIYVCHSTADDNLSVFGRGLVEPIEEKLRIELNKRLGNTVSIYSSNDASQSSSADPPNVAVTNSAVFMAVTDRGSTQSDLCQRELQEFRRELKKESDHRLLFMDRGSVGDQGRVIYVYMRSSLGLLNLSSSFDFHTDLDPPLPRSRNLPSFEVRLGELADAVVEVLRSLKDHPRALSLDKNPSPPLIENHVRSLVDSTSPKRKASLLAAIGGEPWNNLPTEAGLVFVCYSRRDEAFTLELAKILKKRGVRIWIDQWDIPAGANWNLSIDEGLSKCDRLLVVLSPSWLNSRHVSSELHTALDDGKLVVPLLYQSCKIPRELKMIQRFDFTSASLDDDEKMGQLIRDLEAKRK